MNKSTPMLIRTGRVAVVWRRHGWLILGVLWVVALALAYIGFYRNAQATGKSLMALDIGYRIAQLVPLNSGDVRGLVTWELQVGRLLIPVLAAWTTAKALVGVFHDRWQRFLVRFWRGHVVICGLSRQGWLLARSFMDAGHRVVVIENNADNALIGPSRERGAPVLLGNAATADMLQQAGVSRARQVIAVTDDDGVNVEAAIQVAGLLRTTNGLARSHPLTCTVHLVDPQLVELARAREMAVPERTTLRFEMFDVYSQGARLLWTRYGAGDAALEDQPEAANGCSAHVLVVGLGRLGESLVVTAARDWHARLHETPCAQEGRLRITIIDQEAARKCRALSQRYPQLADACDLAPMTVDVSGPEFFEGAYLAGGARYPAVGVVYICFDDDSLGLRVGLAIYHLLRQATDKQVPVIVRMAETTGLARLLEPMGEAPGAFAGLYAFGLLDETCTAAIIQGGTHEMLARSLHEGYVQRQTRLGQTPATNPSLVAWDNLPDEIRESNRTEADAIRPHLRALGYDLVPLSDWNAGLFRFTETEVERLAEMEHTRWVAERQATGWRYASGIKDAQAKLSSALVAWTDLPGDERAKCRSTAGELPVNLARAGFQIVPLA
jgi:hypothetical protein